MFACYTARGRKVCLVWDSKPVLPVSIIITIISIIFAISVAHLASRAAAVPDAKSKVVDFTGRLPTAMVAEMAAKWGQGRQV